MTNVCVCVCVCARAELPVFFSLSVTICSIDVCEGPFSVFLYNTMVLICDIKVTSLLIIQFSIDC